MRTLHLRVGFMPLVDCAGRIRAIAHGVFLTAYFEGIIAVIGKSPKN